MEESSTTLMELERRFVESAEKASKLANLIKWMLGVCGALIVAGFSVGIYVAVLDMRVKALEAQASKNDQLYQSITELKTQVSTLSERVANSKDILSRVESRLNSMEVKR
jgi:cell division protein FtsB